MALADELYRLYIARIYPVLANNDPIYSRVLQKCGVGWNASGVAQAHLQSFQQEMKIQAWLGARYILDAASLKPDTIRAKLLLGPQMLYRVSGNATDQKNHGIWWFTEQVAQRCRDEAGPDSQARLQWLRDVLAVCFNWNSFDHIVRFTLHAGEEIPAVLGRGLPMPHYKLDPYIDPKTGVRVVLIPGDYYTNKGKDLLGGELQVILPWVPVQRVQPANTL